MFILTKKSLNRDGVFVEKYLRAFLFDEKGNRSVGYSTSDINKAMRFNSEDQIKHLEDPVWTKRVVDIS